MKLFEHSNISNFRIKGLVAIKLVSVFLVLPPLGVEKYLFLATKFHARSHAKRDYGLALIPSLLLLLPLFLLPFHHVLSSYCVPVTGESQMCIIVPISIATCFLSPCSDKLFFSENLFVNNKYQGSG